MIHFQFLLCLLVQWLPGMVARRWQEFAIQDQTNIKVVVRDYLHDHFDVEYVKSIFIIHVGGTRCVTFSTDNIMKIRARITLTVEFIRECIFIFLLYV